MQSLDKTSYRDWWRDLRDRMRAAGKILDPLKEERIKELQAKFAPMKLFRGESSSEIGEKGRQVRHGNYVKLRRKSDGFEFCLNRSFQDAGLTRNKLAKALAKNPSNAVVCGESFERIADTAAPPTADQYPARTNGVVAGECEGGLHGRQVSGADGGRAIIAAA